MIVVLRVVLVDVMTDVVDESVAMIIVVRVVRVVVVNGFVVDAL